MADAPPVDPGPRETLRRAADSTTAYATASAYLAAWRLVGRLPEERALRLFDRIADRVHAGDGAGVRTLRANLRRVRPGLNAGDLEVLTHQAVRSYLRYWCESFRLPTWPVEDLVARTRTVHEEHLRTPYDAGRGVVGVLPHQGNWDWAGAWACATGAPVMTVAERLRPERLFDRFVAYRESLGMVILPLTGGPPPLPALAEYLRAGGFVCLLADRDLTRTGVEVDLCGQRARVAAGPAMLARSTGAALVPITTAYDGRELELTFHPEVPVPAGRDGRATAMQAVADAFTTALRAHPADWHMMQRVFVEDLEDDA